ncbi:MAG: hypothetical protein KDA24_22610 [Deltaproteobacteria bacterium]|nr:hypothetical protein [Deltaproteobacteria bacterium]
MDTDVDPRALSDVRLLELARPKGVRGALRRVGCPVVLVAAGWLSWAAAGWVGAHTWEWLRWVAFPLLFLPVGVLFSAVLAVVAGRGSAPLWTEARRRVGQLPFEADLQAVRDDLADRADDQRGWVILLRGIRHRDRLVMRLRIDLRTDTMPPCGEVAGVRGPRFDTIVNPPRSLDPWEQGHTELVGSVVADLGKLLSDADLGALPHDRRTENGGWRGLIIQVAPTANEWAFASKVLPDTTVLDHLVAAAMAGLSWERTGSPVPAPAASPDGGG